MSSRIGRLARASACTTISTGENIIMASGKPMAAPAGAAIGFPEAMMMFSPVEIVVQALARASLPMRDDIARDLGATLERARAQSPGGPRLGPEDYQRLFDPGFVQFCAVELAKVRTALA